MWRGAARLDGGRDREGCVCLYPQGERWQKRESETEMQRDRDRDGKAERDKERTESRREGGSGGAARAFCKLLRPILWPSHRGPVGWWRCPQNLEGAEAAVCASGVQPQPVSLPAVAGAGWTGAQVQRGGSRTGPGGSQQRDRGRSQRGRACAPTCSLLPGLPVLRPPGPPARPNSLLSTLCPPVHSTRAHPFRLFGFGVRGRGAQRLMLGEGLGGLLSMYRTAVDTGPGGRGGGRGDGRGGFCGGGGRRGGGGLGEGWRGSGAEGEQDQAHIWHSGQLTIKMLSLLPRKLIDRGWRGPVGRRRAQREAVGRASAATRARAALPAPPSPPPALSLSCSHRLVLIIFFLYIFSPASLAPVIFFSFNFFFKTLAVPQSRRQGGVGWGHLPGQAPTHRESSCCL